MNAADLVGWERLVAGADPFRGDGRFPIPAYSEFMPGPFVGRRPSGEPEPSWRPPDHAGFHVTPYEDAFQLRPGLEAIAQRVVGELRRLADGRHALSRALLADNPYWPDELCAAAAAGRLAARPIVTLLPLALARTLDDKGRVRWTLFGASEQGPARPFWRSFQTGPGVPLSDGEARALLGRVAALPPDDLRAAGLRVLPAGPDPDFSFWADEALPACARELLLDEHAPPDRMLAGARTLLTFRPFSRLPAPVRSAFLDGALELCPFPGSLVFFGHAGYRKLARALPTAMQIPLLHLFPGNHAAPSGIRVPTSGWLVERELSSTAKHAHGPVVSHAPRTSRWDRSHRDENEVLAEHFDKVGRVLFSTDPEALGLYGKPMARNAQIWTDDHQLVLDGPRCAGDLGRQRLDEAARAIAAGGHFGYRFQFPPMRVGRFELHWHLPLVAREVEGGVRLDGDGATGFFTACPPDGGPEALATPVELWPRLAHDDRERAAATLFHHDHGHARNTTAYNCRKLLEAHRDRGGPLPPTLARRLLTASREVGLRDWLGSLPTLASDPARGRRLAE